MKTILLLLIILFRCSLSFAQWQNVGLAGDTVNCMATSETNFLAGSDKGVFTTDNGSGWQPAGDGLTNTTITGLLVNGTSVFAIFRNSGIYVSNDNGQTWNACNENLYDSTHVSCILLLGTYIYAGTTTGGIYFSKNNGAGWETANTGLLNQHINALTANDNTLYAATANGIYESNTDGANWLSINFKKGNVSSLILVGNAFFAGTDSGLYTSKDFGANWVQAGNGITANHVYSIVESEANLFAGTDKGIFLSKDGANWISVNEGVGDMPVSSIILSDNNLYIGTMGNGVWKRSVADLLTGVRSIYKVSGDVNVYPNPAYNTLIISGGQLYNADITIVNTIGQVLFTQLNNPSLKTTSIDVSNLKTGTYLISVKQADGSEVVREFVKN